MQVPKLEKVIINIGVGEAIQNPKALDEQLAILLKSVVKNR
jgi:large subunit ribosomal protein L5